MNRLCLLIALLSVLGLVGCASELPKNDPGPDKSKINNNEKGVAPPPLKAPPLPGKS